MSLYLQAQTFLQKYKFKEFFHGSAAIFLLRVYGVGMRFGLSILLARVLGVSSYGYFAYAYAWFVLLSLPCMLGMDHIQIRYIPNYIEQKQWGKLKGLLSFARFSSFIVALVVGAIACILFFLFKSGPAEGRITLVIFVGLLPLLVLSQTQQAAMRSLNRPAFAQIPEHVLNPTLLVVGIYIYSRYHDSMSATGAAWFHAVSWLLIVMVGFFLLLRMLPAPVRESPVSLDDRPAWLMMIPSLLLMNFSFQLLNRGPVLILGVLGTNHDVGVFAVATKAGEFMEFVYGAVTLVGAPIFSSLYAKGNKAELQHFATTIAKTIWWISLPVAGFFLIMASWFLKLYGPDFTVGVGAMRILLSTYFFTSLFGFVEIMLIVAGHQRAVAWTTGGAAVINLLLCVFLIPPFGILGAAIAVALSLICMKAGWFWLVYKRLGIVSFPIQFKSVSPAKP